LLEHRLQDAAKRLMEEHGLSCVEAGDLLNIEVCKDGRELCVALNRCWRRWF
jgi:hypothetical protein